MNNWHFGSGATSSRPAQSGEPDEGWVVDTDAWPDQLSMLASAEPAPAKSTDALLTRREQQILACLVRGGSAKEVARELFISEGTVRKHRENLRTKLGLRSTAALVAWAIERGLQPAAKPGKQTRSKI